MVHDGDSSEAEPAISVYPTPINGTLLSRSRRVGRVQGSMGGESREL